MKINPLTCIDYYKADHRRQYPKGTTLVYSNFTPRSTKHSHKIEGVEDKIVFFGLQYFIKWFLIDTFNSEFFSQPKDKVIAVYKRRMDTSLGVGAIPVDHIEALHDLGYLPISIRALPEGAAVGEKIPVFTIENTLPEFFWLTNYLETILSNMIWKPCTSATTAFKYKQLLTKYARLTGGDEGFVGFQAHDFSFRGMSSPQDAAASGAGHLLSFVGTDTIPAIDFLEQYYNANAEKELIGCSVPATEHSVMTMNGPDGEFEIFKRLITELYPKGIVSIVSDSFDFWQVITDFLPRLKSEILARTGGFPVDKVVIRPDSGDPVKIICGDEIEILDNNKEAMKFATDLEKAGIWIAEGLVEDIAEETPHGECGEYEVSKLFKYKGAPYQINVEIEWNRHDKQYYYIDGHKVKSIKEVILTAEQKGAIESLWDTFGGTVTAQGYKVLDSHIGLIYGDSITLDRCEQIMKGLAAKGFASTNVVLGVGSYTYQYVTRDSLGFAMKATAGIVNGEIREIFKDPKTDAGLKKSAKGFLSVEKNESGYVLKDQVTREISANSHLVEVFRDGTLLINQSLSEIRARLTV